jgi:ubiquinone/menaquinone biosynthesis C-methylase UbiE
MTPETYTHGHHESVLRSHRARTAENSAAYLLPELRGGMDLLDVGCGPGTITVDLARIVAPGRVTGIDRSAEIVADATAYAREQRVDAAFEAGDVYALRFAAGAFDVVHAHQVLQHLADPVAALREMRRVLRPGGIVAARDGDYASFAWAPADTRLDRWLAIYREVARRNGGEPDAGRYLKAWAIEAGFTDVRASSSTWTFADADSCRWWADLWADRISISPLAQQAVAYGLADAAELADIAVAWRAWAEAPGAMFIVPHGEIIARG